MFRLPVVGCRFGLPVRAAGFGAGSGTVCLLKPVAVGLVVGDGGIDLFGCVHHEIISGGDGFVDGLGGEE